MSSSTPPLISHKRLPLMSFRFPGHYSATASSPALSTRSYKTVSNLIIMSEVAGGHSDQEFDNADIPLTSMLVTTPNSPYGRSYGMPIKEDTDEEGPQIVHEPSPSPPPTPPTPLPAYHPHPRYYYNDGSVFILMEGYCFRIHHYLLPDDGNIINELLREQGCDAIHPLRLPEDIKISAFEHILQILYRHPLDRTTIPIKVLKDACLAANALRMSTLCESIAKYIIETDCPDEPLDEAVPKYVLSIKLPHHFLHAFKDAQVDKLCCATATMSHSHMYELGFTELGKVWKGAFAARAGYDGQKTEIYEPPPVPARTSYLIKVKNLPGYRAAKAQLFS